MLTHEQARVLGALMEKQVTTPDAYPLTLNALTTACNQSSNRDPVVRYEPTLVETTVLNLKAQGLARVVHPGMGERSTKYRQVAHESLHLEPDELAIICVLLLRGAQTVGELRTRTERMHAFPTTTAVEEVLQKLAGREEPLVQRLERRVGQKEDRWTQLLEDDPYLGPEDGGGGSSPRAAASSAAGAARDERIAELEGRVEALELAVARLREALGD
jgi:uncharacterized protein